MSTRFSVVCTGWASGDPGSTDQLTYKFLTTSPGGETQLIYSGLGSSMPPIALPLGNPNADYLKIITVRVSDPYGSATEKNVTVTVSLLKVTDLYTILKSHFNV